MIKTQYETKNKFKFIIKLYTISYVFVLLILLSFMYSIPYSVYYRILNNPFLGFLFAVGIMTFSIIMILLCYFNDPNRRN